LDGTLAGAELIGSDKGAEPQDGTGEDE